MSTINWQDKKTKAVLLILLLAMILAGWSASSILPLKSDWNDVYRPVALRLISGESPYKPGIGYFNAPWTLLPFIPIALLPPQLSRATMFVISLICYFVIAIKMGAKPLAAVAILLSYPTIYGLVWGQIDVFVWLGFIMPPTIGLFFVLAKPQVGIAIAVFWFVEAWQIGGLKKVLKTFMPVSVGFLLSFAIYGFWLADMTTPLDALQNTSLFPQSIPIGIALLVSAIQNKKRGQAISSSPFLSPYLAVHSWGTVFLGLLPNNLLVIVTSICIWIVFLLRGGAAAG